jgi:thiol:disulfide interchange protein DsbC
MHDRLFPRRSFLALLGAVSLSACAQQPASSETTGVTEAPAATAAQIQTRPGTPEDRARQAILSINPRVLIDRIEPAPLPGFREVIVSGQVLYVSDDGKYMLQGPLFDVVAKEDLSQVGLAEVRRTLVSQIPRQDRIVFAPPNPKYTVTVFTDVECGYCRRLHQQIAEYNKRGIAIEYVAFPRMGLGSEDFRTMVSVWCANDRRKALTDAKNGKRIPERNCTNPVTMHYDIGQRIGLTGTPLILAEDGTQMPGYLPPDALLSTLESLGKDKDAPQAPAMDPVAATR